MADPTPALASGSDPMIESVEGAMVSAMPAAAIAIRHTMEPVPDDASSAENR